jgi:Flp pilus assembly protein TadD
MRRLFNSRQDDAADLDRAGPGSQPLEGELRYPDPEESGLLLPFGTELPPEAAAIPAGEAGSSLEQTLRQAADLERLGRRLDAMLVLRRALRETTSDHRLFLTLAELVEADGGPEEALSILDDGLRATGGEPSLRIARGALLGRLNRHSEAEAELRLALSAVPDSVEALLHVGLSRLRRGRHAEAAHALEHAARREPTHPDVAFHLGEARYHAGDWEGALEALERAASLAPRDPRAYKLLGRLLDRMGRTEEAMSMHRKAREAGAG